MIKNKKNGASNKKALVGAGLAIAAAGAYLLYKNKDGKVGKSVKSFVEKGKRDAVNKYKKLKDKSEKGYKEAVSAVMQEYAGIKNINPKELEVFGKELKAHWKNIKKSVKAGKARASKR